MFAQYVVAFLNFYLGSLCSCNSIFSGRKIAQSIGVLILFFGLINDHACVNNWKFQMRALYPDSFETVAFLKRISYQTSRFKCSLIMGILSEDIINKCKRLIICILFIRLNNFNEQYKNFVVLLSLATSCAYGNCLIHNNHIDLKISVAIKLNRKV